MRKIYIAETHDQVYYLWRAQAASGRHILHVDFHCDLCGLLIDRPAQRAYPLPEGRRTGVDEGNFLKHAVLEGQVQSIRWVHDVPGGRADDETTVKYESDQTAQPHRWLLKRRGETGLPLRYEELVYADWTGLQPGEDLDIDWDFFAAFQYDYSVPIIQEKVRAFFDRDFRAVPEQITVCYSPHHSHDSRDQFELFIEQLATRFTAETITLPRKESTPRPKTFYERRIRSSAAFKTARSCYDGLKLRLRKHGIY